MHLHRFSTVPLACCALATTVLLSSCATLRGDRDASAELPANQQQLVYQQARQLLEKRRYADSIASLQLLLSNFPSGPYAEQAQLDLAYAHYRSFDPASAAAAVDYFLALYPEHPQRAYALYLRGLSSFSTRTGLLLRWLPIDRSRRDTEDARQAFGYFSALLEEYPDSDFAQDARARARALRNLMARHELQVASYYLKRRAWLAAAKRGHHVILHYPHSPATADAIATMSYAYERLGLATLARDTARSLALNHPDHPSLNAEGTQVRPLRQTFKQWLSYLGVVPLPAPPLRQQGQVGDTVSAGQVRAPLSEADAGHGIRRRQLLRSAGIGGGIGMLAMLNSCAQTGGGLQAALGALGRDATATKSQAAMGLLADTLDEISASYIAAQGHAPGEIAEGYRYVAQLLGAAFEQHLDGDPMRPYFIRTTSPIRKLLGDNPDAIYYSSQLDGRFGYTLRGRRTGREYLGITVYGGGTRGQWNLPGTAHINHRQIKYENRRGDYEIHLGPEPGNAPNWLQTGPQTRYVICRHYYEHTVSAGGNPDIDPMPSIEPVRALPPPGRLSDGELARRLLAVTTFMRQSTVDLPMRDRPFAAKAPNQVGTPFKSATMGRENHMGAIDNTYSAGSYLLEPGQVLLMEGELPTCYFANVVITNRFLQSGDFRYRTTSLNRNQLQLEPDGSYRIAISARNPNTANWLDTAGRRFGLIHWRFILAEGQVSRPRLRVVSFAAAQGLPTPGQRP